MIRDNKNVRRARKTFLAMSLSAAMMGSVLGGVAPVKALAASNTIQEDFEENYSGYVRGDATATCVDGGRTGKALKLSNRAQNWHTYSYDVKDYAGMEAEVEAYVKTSDSQVVVECHSNNGKDNYEWLLVQEAASADEWTKISGTITIPEGAQELYFSTGSGTEEYMLDDVKITFKAARKTIVEESFDAEQKAGYLRGEPTAEFVDGGRAGKALKISNRAQNWHTYSYDVKDYAGMEIELEAYMKTSGANAVVECHSKNGEDNYEWLINENVTSADGWTKLSGTITLPEGAQELYFSTGGGTEDYLLDDIKITCEDKVAKAEDKTIAIKEIKPATMYNATVAEDGDSLKVDLAAQWDEARFEIPEDIANRVEGFKINGDESNFGSMSVKMLVKDDKYTENSGEEFAVAYTTSQIKAKNTNLVPIKYVGIMNHSDGPITFKIDSITFFLNDGTVVDRSIEKDIPDLRDVLTANGIDRTGVAVPASALTDSDRMDLVHKHFNSVTCENEMKPQSILGGEPAIVEKTAENKLGLTLHFEDGDKILDDLMAYNKEHGTDIKMRGHVLAWHSQTPAWFYHEDYDTSKPLLSKEAMLERLDNYIEAVMDHYYGETSPYKGMIYAWDVVNEAVSDATNTIRKGDGTGVDTASVKTSWYDIFPQDDTFICEAFKIANKYAPADVKLFYNDYNDTTPAKVKGICTLLSHIKATKGARIDGMGMQGHYGVDSPSLAEFENAVRAYSAIVDEVQVTELDFKASNGYTGAKDQVEGEYTKLGHRYKNLFNKINELEKEDGINFSAVVFWGTDDGHSWLNDSNTVGGAGDGSPVCPLLFDANYQSKPAYWGIVDQDSLLPFVKEVDSLNGASSALDFEQANATIIPSWDKDGLTFKVQVKDDTKDNTDSVVLYLDLSNDRDNENNDAIEKYSINRKHAKEIEGGYEVEFKIDKDVKVLQDVLFDVVVKNGDKVTSYNDLTNNQSKSSKYYAKMSLKPYMTIAKGKANIDGKADDAAWKNVAATKLDVIGGKPEATATTKVMWDEENLYVLVEVKDPTVDVSAAAEYEQDSVEIFIDEDNKKTDSFDGNDKQYRISADNVQSFNGESCTKENITSKTTKTKDGYIVEAAIKWTSLKAKEGSEIGIDVQINDGKEGSRIGTANWYDASGSGWSKSSVFGTAKLVKGAAADQQATTQAPSTQKPSTQATTEAATKVTVGKTKITSAKNSKAGKIVIKLKKVDGAQYEITYGTNKNFKKAKVKTTKKTTYTIKKVKKGKTYYIKARAFKVVDGKNVYSKKYTGKKIVKVKK